MEQSTDIKEQNFSVVLNKFFGKYPIVKSMLISTGYYNDVIKYLPRFLMIIINSQEGKEMLIELKIYDDILKELC